MCARLRRRQHRSAAATGTLDHPYHSPGWTCRIFPDRVMRTAGLVLLAFGLLRAHPPAKIDVRCTPEQIDELGLTCTAEQPCPIYLELTSADSTAGRLFVSGNLHTAS